MGIFASLFGGKGKGNKSESAQAPSAASSRGVYKVGDCIGNKYYIRYIYGGEGLSGMGVVYICSNNEDNTVVALKTLQDRYLRNNEILSGFKREALSWVRLGKHPYIVAARYTNTYDNRMFIVFEYVAPDQLNRNTVTGYLNSSITIKTILEWSIQFCHGMEHARQMKVTPHRDIKPDNLMVTRAGTLKITDFGLAGILAGPERNSDLSLQFESSPEKLSFIKLTRGGMACGTAPWMAPEQYDGQTDARSDIYSYGLVMYQMLRAGDPTAHMANTPQSLWGLPFYPKRGESWEIAHRKYVVPELDSPLFPVIDRCLRKNPDDRFGGVAVGNVFNELRDALEAIYETVTGTKPIEPPSGVMFYPDDKYNQGLSLQTLGLIDEAILVYREALQLYPQHLGACNNLGNILREKGQLDEAMSLYRHTVQINPEFALGYANIGNVLADKGLVDEAISKYRHAISIDPKNMGFYVRLGNLLMRKGELDEAISLYRLAINIHPRLKEAYEHLATALIKKGLLDDAISVYRDAIRFNPDNVYFYVKLGGAMVDKGELDEAIIAFRHSIRLNPREEAGYNGLGNILIAKGAYDDAIDAYRNAIRSNPDIAVFHANLGIALLHKKHFDEAISAFLDAIKLNPEYAHAYCGLGIALKDKGQYEEAISAHRNAIRIYPEYADAFFHLGKIMIVRGAYDDAISAYRQAVQINPRYASAYFNLGIAYNTIGQFNEAIQAFEMYIRVAPPEDTSSIQRVKEMISLLNSKIR